MVVSTRETFLTTIYMAQEFINGMTDEFMMASGNTTKCTGSVTNLMLTSKAN